MRSIANRSLAQAALALALASACASARAEDAPEAGPVPRIALLPVENLTDRVLDAAPVEAALRAALEARGLALLDAAALTALMDAHRVRYTGGVDPELAAAFRDEAAVSGVLVTSVERWTDVDPPALSLTLRLVSTDSRLRVVWMDSAAVTGEDHPGFLDLGVVRDPGALLERAVAELAQSLADRLAGKTSGSAAAPRRFRPRKEFRRADGPLTKIPSRVAVLPFTNRSPRRHGGELLALHFVAALAERPELEVVEPGLVRDILLRTRLIPEGGIAFNQAGLLKELLGADLVLTGDVLDYADHEGEGLPPEVDFTAQLLDTNRRSVVWSSFNHNTGADGVWFFDAGRVRSAGGLVDAMAGATVSRMLREPRGAP